MRNTALRIYADPLKPGEGLHDNWGCGASSPWTDLTYSSPLGDVIPWSYMHSWHRIESAWMRAQGDNIKVGVLDTGLDPAQDQFFAQFNANSSASRTLQTVATQPSSTSPAWRDDCGHGTRVAGLISAPHDGFNTVGIAWKSDLMAVRVTPDVAVIWSSVDVYQGIEDAVSGGSRIIQMAFGIIGGDAGVADLIRLYYYHPQGPLFVAAMGNNSFSNATFPADMQEVIGVVALTNTGARHSASNWGPSAELGAYTAAATVGVPSRFGTVGPVTVSQTSAASATISGIAALVWSMHPGWRNTDVRHRLRMAASHPHQRNWQNGYGPVDAYKAVGGVTYMQIGGALCAAPGEEVVIDVDADGDGPFAFQWSTGSTARHTLIQASSTVGGKVAADVRMTDLITGQYFYAYGEVVTVQGESGECGAGETTG